MVTILSTSIYDPFSKDLKESGCGSTYQCTNPPHKPLVLHTNDYCGKRFGDNRRFQYTATALCRSYKEGPRKVGCVREVSDGQVVAR